MIDHQAKSPFQHKSDGLILDAIEMITMFLNNGGPEEDPENKATDVLCGIQMGLSWVLGLRDEEFNGVMGSLMVWLLSKYPEKFDVVKMDDVKEFNPEDN